MAAKPKGWTVAQRGKEQSVPAISGVTPYLKAKRSADSND